MNFDHYHQQIQSVIRQPIDLGMAVFHLIINQTPLNRAAPILSTRLWSVANNLPINVLVFNKPFGKIEKRIR